MHFPSPFSFSFNYTRFPTYILLRLILISLSYSLSLFSPAVVEEARSLLGGKGNEPGCQPLSSNQKSLLSWVHAVCMAEANNAQTPLCALHLPTSLTSSRRLCLLSAPGPLWQVH